MPSRSSKLFCNTSVSSLLWALVTTLFSLTHFRAFLAVMADVIKQINTTITALKHSQLPARQRWLLPLQGLQGHHSLRRSTRSRAGRGVQTLTPFPPSSARPAETKSDTFVLLNSGHDIKISVENHPEVSSGVRPLQAV